MAVAKSNYKNLVKFLEDREDVQILVMAHEGGVTAPMLAEMRGWKYPKAKARLESLRRKGYLKLYYRGGKDKLIFHLTQDGRGKLAFEN